jgi:hypothetical protein
MVKWVKWTKRLPTIEGYYLVQRYPGDFQVALVHGSGDDWYATADSSEWKLHRCDWLWSPHPINEEAP